MVRGWAAETDKGRIVEKEIQIVWVLFKRNEGALTNHKAGKRATSIVLAGYAENRFWHKAPGCLGC